MSGGGEKFSWLAVCSRSVEDKAHELSVEEMKSVNGVCVLLAGVCTNRYCTGFVCLGERRPLHTCRQVCVMQCGSEVEVCYSCTPFNCLNVYSIDIPCIECAQYF